MAWGTESTTKRGYGWSWQKLRLDVLRRDNGLCQCDQCKGGRIRVRIATEVDHIKPKAQGGTDEMSNLRSLHHDCHVRITNEQQGKRRRSETGMDGYPR